jgi:glycosyltransferase involved in cell wall biosynthesis
LLRASDVLILPSVEEGSALVTYEAQACGCVLLVSDAAGARVENGRHGFVHAVGDVSTLTEHLRALHDDPALLASLRRHVVADAPRLTWRAAGRKLHAVYAAVAA